MQLLFTNICSMRNSVLCLTCETSWWTHIIKNTVIIQSKGFNGAKTQENHKQDHDRLGHMQTLIVRRQPFETDWEGSHHLVWGTTQCRAIKEGSKVNNRACSLPQNIHLVTYKSEYQDSQWPNRKIYEMCENIVKQTLYSLYKHFNFLFHPAMRLFILI